MKTPIALVTALGAVFLTTSLQAEPPERPRSDRPRGIPEELKKYDLNADGKLDETERAAVKADIESGKLEPPKREGRGGPGGPGGPKLPPELLKQYDTDADGKLNETERAALKADIDSGKVKPPQRPDKPAKQE